MGLGLEILELILGILWSYLESAYRLIISVPRKKIDGEIALVTGGGGKIGECIATELAKENVKIVLWDVNENAVDRVASKLRKEGATVYTYQCDLTSKDHVYSVAQKVKEEVGHVTILINNAGILIARKFLNCTDQELAKQVEVNTTSHFWTTKAFLPHMQEINHGHIVTVSSVAGLSGVHNLVAYCTSKFGATGFHQALSRELEMTGKSGIKTTCLCPFFTDTPLIGKTSARIPLLFPVLEPENVAKELIDGMLRDKSMIILPKALAVAMFVQRLMPEKGYKLLYKFCDVTHAEETAATMFQRRKEASSVEEKSE